MGKNLKRIFFIALGLSVVIGLPIENPYGNFFWHKIPSFDVIFGIISPLIFIGAKMILALVAQRKESFYD
jgi:hypothetical protein